MKKFIAFSLALVLAFAVVSPSYAKSLVFDQNNLIPTGGIALELDERTEQFLEIYTTSGIMSELSTDSAGNMILLNSDVDYLVNTYNVDSEFVELLQAVIADANTKGLTKGLTNDLSIDLSSGPINGGNVAPIKGGNDTIISPMVSVKDWKVYFTNDEVKSYFFAAAGIGPTALAAALNSVAFLLSGPVGTAFTLALSVIGAASLVNLTYLVIQAGTQGKGIYIGVSWNGAFPNYTQGTW